MEKKFNLILKVLDLTKDLIRLVNLFPNLITMSQISSKTFDMTVFDLIEATFLMKALIQGVNPIICSKPLLASILSDHIINFYPGTTVTTTPYGDKIALSVVGSCFSPSKDNQNYVDILKEITQFLRPGSKEVSEGYSHEAFKDLQKAHPEAKFTLSEDFDKKWKNTISWIPVKKSKTEKFLDSYRKNYSMRPRGRIISLASEFPEGIQHDLGREYKDRIFVLRRDDRNHILEWSSFAPKEMSPTPTPVSGHDKIFLSKTLESFLKEDVRHNI